MEIISDPQGIRRVMQQCLVGMPSAQQGAPTQIASPLAEIDFAFEFPPATKRIPADRNDWGDNETVGGFLKRLVGSRADNGRFLG